MTPESEDNLRLEIGHVLFIDLVQRNIENGHVIDYDGGCQANV
jgi:hypothetical protein